MLVRLQPNIVATGLNTDGQTDILIKYYSSSIDIVTCTPTVRQWVVNKLARRQSRLLGYSTIEEAVVSVMFVSRSSGNSGVMQPVARQSLCKHYSTSTRERLCFLRGPCRRLIRKVNAMTDKSVRSWRRELGPGVQKNKGGQPVRI
jgi:hypothetical protein